MIALRILPIFPESADGQIQPTVGDVVHLMVGHLDIAPLKRLVDRGDTAQAVRLDHRGGIRGGIAGVLEPDLLVYRFPDRINRGAEHEKQEKDRQREHHDKTVVVRLQRQNLADTIHDECLHSSSFLLIRKRSSSGIRGNVIVLYGFPREHDSRISMKL